MPDFGPAQWKDLPQNPLVNYGEVGGTIGDPQVLVPEDFDGRWHMFFHGFVTVPGYKFGLAFFHSVSDDGIHWKEENRWNDWVTGQCYLYCDGDRWILYYTAVLLKFPELVDKYGCASIIRARTTRDFVNWSEEIDLILPETPLEREGRFIQTRNPCVIQLPDGRVRMYYSAGTVWLDACGYEEPKYIFYAEADNPLGPFKKIEKPILSPDPALPYRDLGSGAIKVFGYGKGYIAMYNSIWIDKENKPRSAIRMLASDDGLSWEEAAFNPIIAPTEGWRAGIVYQLDVITKNDALWIYFNARDSWKGGTEGIGCCRLDLHGREGLTKLRKNFH
jgi:hypothetical protein